jgi:hypothetical protein
VTRDRLGGGAGGSVRRRQIGQVVQDGPVQPHRGAPAGLDPAGQRRPARGAGDGGELAEEPPVGLARGREPLQQRQVRGVAQAAQAQVRQANQSAGRSMPRDASATASKTRGP